jgi:large-conductance mechanosensitive channel
MIKVPPVIPPEEVLSDNIKRSTESRIKKRLEWWYRFSAPAEVVESANFVIREQYRRGRVASLIILGTLCAILFLLPIIIANAPVAFNLPWVFASAGIGILCCLLAIQANRSGRVQLAGILLIVAVDVIVAGIILSERNGLDPIFLSMFDLLVVTELIAASILNPSSVFGVALINILLIVLDLNFQPHSIMWMQMVMSQMLAYSLLARPVTLYLVVAAVAFLWVRSALRALQRADRAELISALERREVEQKKQLEEEIEQILQVHVRVANGDLNARAPTYQDHALWQVGLALNNLLARFKNSAKAEYSLQRITQDIAQLRIAVRYWQSGQQLQWRPSREIMLNPLIDDIKRALAAPAASTTSTTGGMPPVREQRPGQRPYSPETPLPDVNPFFARIPETPGYNSLDKQPESQINPSGGLQES